MNQEKQDTQKFQVLTSSGESLIKFTFCHNNRPRPLKISKNSSKTLYVSPDNRTTDTEVHIGCPLKRAPNYQTFLIYPENNTTKFYLSLNHIGAKYLVFVTSRSVKMRGSSAFSVWIILRKVCLFLIDKMHNYVKHNITVNFIIQKLKINTFSSKSI